LADSNTEIFTLMFYELRPLRQCVIPNRRMTACTL
jgi:hypothetical protein